MEIGITTGLYYDRNILDVLPLIKNAGFNIVEIWAGAEKYGAYTHFDWHKEREIKSAEACLRELGMSVHSLHSPFSPTIDLSSPDEIIRTFSVSEVERSMYCMKQLGGKYLIVHPASTEQSLQDNINVRFLKCRKSLEKIYISAQDLGVQIALETQLPHIFGGEASILWKLIDGFSPSVCGFCFDTSHANLWAKGALTAFKELYLRVNTLHISDNNGGNDEHLIPGDGAINWPELIRVIRKSNCSEVFMLEVHGCSRDLDPLIVLSRAYENTMKLLHGGTI